MSVPSGGRQIVIHGIAMILAGLVWGLVIPLTPYPRLALGAHIQFETNGLLFTALGLLLLTLPHHVGRKSLWVMLGSTWATWLMALSEAANGWWGTVQMLPISAGQSGATGGEPWQELAIKLTHITAAFGLILSWTLLMIGFLKHDPTSSSTNVLVPQDKTW
ncbi:hypothetical protein [Schlesneria paludicola]|uniref:hypothetical protein n=1 Tax=Schlesneria paludicola TaxID=360056 RepID=UPI00029B1E93|nr:hypothetical protein [Schlesneria paludicola]